MWPYQSRVPITPERGPARSMNGTHPFPSPLIVPQVVEPGI
jgi:hypothetical protein